MILSSHFLFLSVFNEGLFSAAQTARLKTGTWGTLFGKMDTNLPDTRFNIHGMRSILSADAERIADSRCSAFIYQVKFRVLDKCTKKA